VSLNVTNCPKCGRIMMKGPRSICPNCHQQIEDQYEKCLKYLREHRKCTLAELSEATEVSTTQITKFIREGRISVAEFEKLYYECELCGTSIREGHMCEKCRAKFVHDANGTTDGQRRSQDTKGTGFLKDRNLN